MFGAKTRQIDKLKEELRLSQEQNKNAQETLKRINEARKRDIEQADIKIAALKDQIANLEAEKQALFEASKADFAKLNKEVERLRKYERKRDPKTGRFVSKKAQKPETKTSEWHPAPEDRPFKVGDKVKIVDGFEPEEHRNDPITFVMDEYVGLIGVVKSVYDDGDIIAGYDDGAEWALMHKWLEHVG